MHKSTILCIAMSFFMLQFFFLHLLLWWFIYSYFIYSDWFCFYHLYLFSLDRAINDIMKRLFRRTIFIVLLILVLMCLTASLSGHEFSEIVLKFINMCIFCNSVQQAKSGSCHFNFKAFNFSFISINSKRKEQVCFYVTMDSKIKIQKQLFIFKSNQKKSFWKSFSYL